MGSARFTIITPHLVRLEYSPAGTFVDDPSLFAIVRDPSHETHIVRDDAPRFTLETEAFRLEYTPAPGGFTPDNLTIHTPLALWRPGMKNQHNLSGTLETLDRIRARVPLPDGLLARDGWYLLDDSANHLLINNWATPRPAPVSSNTDWYFFSYGTDYRAALRALAAVSGPVPMPRRYALGSWYSRYWPYTSAEYREIIGEYDRRGYPLDVIVMDMDWHKPGWTGWSWNRDLLPDAEELLNWFHDNGLAVTLNLHPADGVGPHEDHYPAFMRDIGRDPASKETVPFDAGDRRYVESLFKNIHTPLEENIPAPPPSGRGLGGGRHDEPSPMSSGSYPPGVDFWWLDWQQDKFTRSIPDLTNLWWLNRLYFNHTSRQHRRGCSFSRWAGWGDHRHPVHFSGDAHTGWDSLAFQVPFTAVAGNVGCFFWSHDIGGHFGPRLEEATTRWVQFGALSPVLRLHSARSGALDRKPWSYKPVYERAMHAAFQLRTELFPYLYSMTRKCHTDTLPLCRPMYIDWPEHPAAYENPQQYMLGDHLLVAPITSPGMGPKKVATQAVWFPPDTPSTRTQRHRATPWYNFHTAERYDPSTEQLVAAEIDEIPVFVPAGVPIPTRTPTLRPATATLDTIVIVCFPGEPDTYHETELYEDDGISDAHENGAYSLTPIRAWWFENELKLEVGIRIGTFPAMLAEREIILELRGVDRAASIRVDGVPMPPIEGTNHRVRIPAGRLKPDEVVRLDVRFEPADSSAIRTAAIARRCAAAEPRLATLPEFNAWSLDATLGATSYASTPRLQNLIEIGSGIGLRIIDGSVLLFSGAHPTDGQLPAGGIDVQVVDVVGSSTTPRSRTTVIVPPVQARKITLPAERVEFPPLGLKATRTVIAACTKAGPPQDTRTQDSPQDSASPLTLRTTIDTRIRHLLTFRAVGPFRYDPTKPLATQSHGPELLPARDRLKAPYIDMLGNPVTWQDAPATDYWPQSIRTVCGRHNGEAMAYALTHVFSPEDQHVTLLLESGDRMELWLDDAKVFTSDAETEVESAIEEVRVKLKKGWSQFLAKTNEGGGGWGFRVSIDGEHILQESFAPAISS